MNRIPKTATVVAALALFTVVSWIGLVAGHPHEPGNNRSCTLCHSVRHPGCVTASIFIGSPAVAVATTVRIPAAGRELRDPCFQENRRGPPSLST